MRSNTALPKPVSRRRPRPCRERESPSQPGHGEREKPGPQALALEDAFHHGAVGQDLAARDVEGAVMGRRVVDRTEDRLGDVVGMDRLTQAAGRPRDRQDAITPDHPDHPGDVAVLEAVIHEGRSQDRRMRSFLGAPLHHQGLGTLQLAGRGTLVLVVAGRLAEEAGRTDRDDGPGAYQARQSARQHGERQDADHEGPRRQGPRFVFRKVKTLEPKPLGHVHRAARQDQGIVTGRPEPRHQIGGDEVRTAEQHHRSAAGMIVGP